MIDVLSDAGVHDCCCSKEMVLRRRNRNSASPALREVKVGMHNVSASLCWSAQVPH